MTFRDRYKFDTNKDLIGKGGFAHVYRALDVVRKRIVALKIYRGTVSSKYDIISEINRMEDIVHPNLIRYYDANIIESTNGIGETEQMQVGILEYANAGHIRQFFRQKKRGEAITKHIILGILEGLKFLHQKNIAHRDLKPKNILLSKKSGQLNAKIADFGISKKLSNNEDDGVSSQLLGSVEYMAPEQFAPTLYGINNKMQTNADLWSLGIIIYEIFMQKLPFGSRTQGINHEQILNKILFEDIDPSYRSLPHPYNEILEKCLVKKASDRAQNAQVLIDILTGKTASNAGIPTPPIIQQNTGSQTKIIQVEPDLSQDDGPTEEILTANQANNTSISEANTVADLPTVNASSLKTQQPYDDSQGEQTQQLDKNKKSSWFSWGKDKPKPKEEKKSPKPVEEVGARSAMHEINVGKNLFKLGNYPESFKILDRFASHQAFDTEATFFLGVMYYNGNCGGPHDVDKGRKLMKEAKNSDRSLVQQLTIKYVL